MMNKTDKVFVAGHRGLVGSALVRCLNSHGYTNLCLRTRAELDLLDQAAVTAFFQAEKPDYVFLAAAKVGGIHANATYKADFIYENLQIQNNVIQSSYTAGVKRLLFLGSSCIYPRLCPQPMREEHLLTGLLEPTNEPYAIAKIAGIKLCESFNQQYGTQFTSVMPTNLYGPGDTYDAENSHVIPSLILKFHQAKINRQDEVAIWGTGTPKREFLYVDDMADACLFVMNQEDAPALLNIGSGTECSILELAHLIAQVVGFNGAIKTNLDFPDGTPRKLLDTSLLDRLGWKANVDLLEGLRLAYQDFLTTKD